MTVCSVFTYGNAIKICGSARQLSGTRWGARGWGRGREGGTERNPAWHRQASPHSSATTRRGHTRCQNETCQHSHSLLLSLSTLTRSHSLTPLAGPRKRERRNDAWGRPNKNNKHGEEKWQGETEHREERNESSEAAKPPGVQS